MAPGYDAGFNGGSYGVWNPTEYGIRFEASAVPEPATLTLLGGGFLALAGTIRRRLIP